MSARQKTSLLRILVIFGSAASLATCLIAPMLFLSGRLDEGSYKSTLLAGSLGWFLCAAALAFSKKETEVVGKG